MNEIPNDDAWNNFVMSSQPEDHPTGSVRRAAAIAKNYMGQANQGGINSFLTYNPEIDAKEVLWALQKVGATSAHTQFAKIMDEIGVPLPAGTEETRAELLDANWSNELDAMDGLSDESDKDLMKSLEKHVLEDQDYYASLD